MTLLRRLALGGVVFIFACAPAGAPTTPDGGSTGADGGAGGPCQDACQIGQTECQAGSLLSCKVQPNGCLDFSNPTPSPTCDGWTTSTCQGARCTPGSTRCSGAQEEDCLGTTSCSDWGAPRTCPGGGTCQGGACDTCGQCPPGYACNGGGVCAGGDAGAIVLDVQTVAVSGSVTLNGAAPANCAWGVQVVFIEPSRGYEFFMPLDAGLHFSGTVYPGTYQVGVFGSQSGACWPASTWIALPALVVTQPVSGIVVDVPAMSVTGKVTLNGHVPTLPATCQTGSGSSATILLTETTHGQTFLLHTPCADSGYRFSGLVYPGTYRVVVMGDGASIPGAGYLAGTFTLDAASPPLALDVQTVAVDGKVTLSGKTPALDPGCANDPTAATSVVTLQEVSKGYQFRFDTLCSDADFSFSGPVYPGTYRVLVSGYSTSIPNSGEFLVIPSVALTAPLTTIAPDIHPVAISGSIGGAALFNCTQGDGATIMFTDASAGVTFAFQALCTSGFSFSGNINPGTYAVNVYLRSGPYLAAPALTIAGDTDGLEFDVPLSRVSGTITLNGVRPLAGTACATQRSPASAQVIFIDAANNRWSQANTLCDDATFSFSGNVIAGTYQVLVANSGGATGSNLPSQPYVAMGSMDASSDVSGLKLDVQTVPVVGHVMLEGALPALGVGCQTQPTAPASTVTFLERNLGYRFDLTTLCTDFTFRFDDFVYPGTYRVMVQGTGQTFSNLPSGADSTPIGDAEEVVVDALQIP
jgi:hypothetical protein